LAERERERERERDREREREREREMKRLTSKYCGVLLSGSFHAG